MNKTDNSIRFPDNIFEPSKIEVDDCHYTLYKVRFNNLYTLYEYLKSDPTINRDVFYRLSSVEGDRDFAGKPYNRAVEELISDVDPGYEEFLKLQRDLNVAKGKIHKYKTIRTVAGGHLNVPAYCAGSPLCYETEEKIMKPKFAKMHVSLSYYWGTNKSQVLNRAIIITNVLKALENAGYSVDLNTFELSSCGDELSHIIVQIKKHGGRLDTQALYKSLCHVEFLRRILFRVLETMDVTNGWCSGYGSTCDKHFTADVLNFGKNDIFFDQPRDMGIRGNDLADDFESAMECLNLCDKIDVDRAKRDFREETKVLVKK